MSDDAFRKEIKLLKALATDVDDMLKKVSSKVNNVRKQITIDGNTARLDSVRNIEDMTNRLITIRNDLEKELSCIHELKCNIVDMNEIIADLEQMLINLQNNK